MNGASVADYYYEKNLQGDIVGIIDSDGNRIVSYEYDSWGRMLATDGSMAATIGSLNPFRYRGCFYDEETGFYYVSSRYYDPEIGRFINEDKQLNNLFGITGLNLYSYCLNNPINKIDLAGNKPGDLFDSPDAAAKDFAEYINERSIDIDCEFGSYIYKKSIWVTTKITYYDKNLASCNFFSLFSNNCFNGGVMRTVIGKKKVTKYSYIEPKKGSAHKVSVPVNWFGFNNKVAEIHTHGAYSDGYEGDVFSAADKNKWLNYLVTPLGTVRKYNPIDGSDVVIFNDVPYDSNHPRRAE